MKLISILAAFLVVAQANFLGEDLETKELAKDTSRELRSFQRDFRQRAPDFRKITFDLDWYVMDDRVMGGSSRSYI